VTAAEVPATARAEERRQDSGDRLWAEAGAVRIAELTAEVRHRAKDIRKDTDIDAVHDMRTATRRLRTALTIYGSDAGAKRRKRVEKGLKRIARRLGTVRDLDVLLGTLSSARTEAGDAIDPDDLAPLRRAWEHERMAQARRLTAELNRGRFRDMLDDAEKLVARPDTGSRRNGPAIDRVATRAPALIWAAYGVLLAYQVDAATADPADIHETRIAAKKLRYTLEAFEDALKSGARLIAEVTAVHDTGGEMHDAIVARDRARSLLDDHGPSAPERTAIESYADSQDRRAQECRPVVARALATVRSRRFRESLGRAAASMGHIESPSSATAR
jgi:CHAD domain-containing protein